LICFKSLPLTNSEKRQEFLAVFSVFPTTGDKIFAKKRETPYVGEFTKDTIGLNGIFGKP
jgi:hypothetical protein